jgi:type II secretory pathway pseudopilin PulG
VKHQLSQPPGRDAGFTIVELVAVVAVAVVLAGVTMPVSATAVDRGRVRAAAAFIASRFRLARIEAVNRVSNVGVVFDLVNGRWQFGRVATGQGMGSGGRTSRPAPTRASMGLTNSTRCFPASTSPWTLSSWDRRASREIRIPCDSGLPTSRVSRRQGAVRRVPCFFGRRKGSSSRCDLGSQRPARVFSIRPDSSYLGSVLKHAGSGDPGRDFRGARATRGKRRDTELSEIRSASVMASVLIGT